MKCDICKGTGYRYNFKNEYCYEDKCDKCSGRRTVLTTEGEELIEQLRWYLRPYFQPRED